MAAAPGRDGELGEIGYVPSSAGGCHRGSAASSWILKRQKFNRRRLGLRPSQRCPDLSVDPRTHRLSFLNETGGPRAYFVSVRHRCFGAGGVELARGTWRDAGGALRKSVTFIVTVAPLEVLDVCRILVDSLRSLDIYSDIVSLRPDLLEQCSSSPRPSPLGLGFPFAPGTAYLCSQAWRWAWRGASSRVGRPDWAPWPTARPRRETDPESCAARSRSLRRRAASSRTATTRARITLATWRRAPRLRWRSRRVDSRGAVACRTPPGRGPPEA